MKRVLITGGAGFIGANLVPLLLASGYAVRVLDNFSTGQRSDLAGLDFMLCICVMPFSLPWKAISVGNCSKSPPALRQAFWNWQTTLPR